MEIRWPSRRQWKESSKTIIPVVFLVFLFWWWPGLFGALFDSLPDVASVLLMLVGLGALVPEIQERLPVRWRFWLFIGLGVIGFLGVVSNTVQRERDRELLVGELTGGDTYCYFTADTSQGSGSPVMYPVVIWVSGAYPMRNVVAEIQTFSTDSEKQSRSRRQIRLGSGELLPGVHPVPDRIGIGRHIIVIESRTGRITEELNIVESSGHVTQFGDVYGGGKKLETIGEVGVQ